MISLFGKKSNEKILSFIMNNSSHFEVTVSFFNTLLSKKCCTLNLKAVGSKDIQIT